MKTEPDNEKRRMVLRITLACIAFGNFYSQRGDNMEDMERKGFVLLSGLILWKCNNKVKCKMEV